MRLGQIHSNGDVIAAVIEDGLARPIPGHSTIDLIRRAEAEKEPLGKLAAKLASRHPEELALTLPVTPPEVWACGCTYETSASFRDAEHGTREGPTSSHSHLSSTMSTFWAFSMTAKSMLILGRGG